MINKLFEKKWTKISEIIITIALKYCEKEEYPMDKKMQRKIFQAESEKKGSSSMKIYTRDVQRTYKMRNRIYPCGQV